MLVKASLNYLRIAPRKTRLVADLIRGKSVEQARTILNFTIKKSKDPFLKLLNQAVSNAQNNFQLEEKNLYIAKIFVDEGPKLKRWRPRSRGQAYEIQKKTSHLNIILDQINAKLIKKKKTKKSALVEKSAVAEKPEKDQSEKKQQFKFRPETQKQIKPKVEKTINKIFKRKAF